MTRFDRAKVTPWIALRNTIGVALPLAIGVLIGSVPAGLAVATGALNVSYSDSDEPYIRRTGRMFAASVLVGFAVFMGSLCGGRTELAVAVAGGWALGAGLLVALSGAAADVGTISLVTLIVYEAVPRSPEIAMYGGLLAFGGGILQTAITTALWPFRRFGPERRAVAALYLDLSRVAKSPGQATNAPPASNTASDAQAAIAALGVSRSIEAERMRILLDQAERTRLCLLLLSRLRTRLQRDYSATPEAQLLDESFEAASRLLAVVASLLSGDRQSAAPQQELEAIALAATELRSAAAQPRPARAMIGDARRQLDALSGQLRSALDLAGQVTAIGAAEYEHREAARPWTLRLMGTLAILRANLHADSAAFRHAARLAACVTIGAAIGRGFGLERSYWLPMTVAIVLKPDFTATFSRGVLRLAGTFGGLLIATVIFHLLAAVPLTEVALIAVFMFLARCFGRANYGVFVIAITGLVVALVSMTGLSPGEVITARALNTVWGGLIALLAYWLWPTWERRRVGEALALMLDAYRDYFRAIRRRYEHPGTAVAAELDRARLASRLARSNLEASIEKVSAEPGSDTASLELLSRVLSSSHRMVHAIMALEAELTAEVPVAPLETFAAFANGVELTLYYLAAALRGSPIPSMHLPDLRERHHGILESEAQEAGDYSVINIETDRITNSLNTVSELVFLWLAMQPASERQPGMLRR